VLSLNAQKKRSKRARLSVEARAAENAAAAQRMQVHRGQFTEEARVDANAQAAHRQYCQHCMGEYVNDCRLVIYLSTKLYFIGTVGIYEVRIGITVESAYMQTLGSQRNFCIHPVFAYSRIQNNAKYSNGSQESLCI
jgi:hypothetical protein